MSLTGSDVFCASLSHISGLHPDWESINIDLSSIKMFHMVLCRVFFLNHKISQTKNSTDVASDVLQIQPRFNPRLDWKHSHRCSHFLLKFLSNPSFGDSPWNVDGEWFYCNAFYTHDLKECPSIILTLSLSTSSVASGRRSKAFHYFSLYEEKMSTMKEPLLVQTWNLYGKYIHRMNY